MEKNWGKTVRELFSVWANPLVARKENEIAQTGANLGAAKVGVFDVRDKPQRRFRQIMGAAATVPQSCPGG